MSKGALGLLSAYWPERTARHAHVPLERVTDSCVHKPAAAGPERPALVTPTRTVSFAELSAMVRGAAAAVRPRVPDGGRVAIAVDDPVDLVACTLAAVDADRLAWGPSSPIDPAVLPLFAPDLVVTAPAGAGPPGVATVTAEELFGSPPPGPAVGRPALRTPVLTLTRPGGGEVLHSHRTLLATAIAFSSFFMLEPGSEIVLLDPVDHWLGLAAALATWHRQGTVRVAWTDDWRGHPDRVDYAVVDWDAAVRRYLGDPPMLRDVRAGVGAIAGLSAPFSASRRRRLARRLGTPVLTVYGRNDLGPVLGSHPTWYLDEAAGIPLPNVDLRPLNPFDGSELTIGWDAVEEGEMGVKSALAPAGGELSGSWLRTRHTASVDPTGLYFLDRPTPSGPDAS